jgi:hypothetical protein
MLEASLTRYGYGLIVFRFISFAQITVATPARDTCSKEGSPCNSEGHSALACGRGFHHHLDLWTVVLTRTNPLHRHYLVFQLVFRYTLLKWFCQENLPNFITDTTNYRDCMSKTKQFVSQITIMESLRVCPHR